MVYRSPHHTLLKYHEIEWYETKSLFIHFCRKEDKWTKKDEKKSKKLNYFIYYKKKKGYKKIKILLKALIYSLSGQQLVVGSSPQSA